jgi:hypothetical protein
MGRKGIVHGKARFKSPLLCATKYCRGRRTKCHAKCSKCRMRLWRAKHPVRAAWNTMRDHANKRKLPFDLPFDVFSALATAAGYPNGRALHCDRKDAKQGYTLENIRFIDGSENVAKGNRERHLPDYIKHLLQRKGITPESTMASVSDLQMPSVADNGESSVSDNGDHYDSNNAPF